MPQPSAMEKVGTLVAQRYASDILERLTSIARTQIQLVALQQSPRKNYLAAGGVHGAGTVGTTPSTCNVQVLGQPAGVILAPNLQRRGLNVQNTSAAGGPSLTLGLGITQPTAGAGLVLPPGASWDGRVSGELWVGTIAVVASTAGCTFAYLEVQGPNAGGPNEGL